MKKNVRAFAELYLHSSLFADKANQTMGLPLVNDKVDFDTAVDNRRNVTDRLTEAGRKALKNFITELSVAIGKKVKVKWDIHCGCSMCPCSPGFRVYADIETQYHRFTEDDRFNIWMDEDGSIRKISRPKYKFRYANQDTYESIMNLYDNTKTREDH